MSDAVLKTSKESLDELLQWEQHITSTLPDSKVIILKPTLHTDNGLATLIQSNLNGQLEQMEIGFIGNSNIKGLHQGQKSLRLNKKGKHRLELNLLGKLWNI